MINYNCKRGFRFKIDASSILPLIRTQVRQNKISSAFGNSILVSHFSFPNSKLKLTKNFIKYNSEASCISARKVGICEYSRKKVMSKISMGENQITNSTNSIDSRVIVITSGKGGVGKTTATANLGMSIARLGYKVALIDADIGLRNLDLLLGLENRILYTAIDILEGQCRLDQALIRDKRWKNLSLLSISKNRQRYNVTRKNMDNLVKSVSSLGYHFILIDCPAGIDVGFINAISPADEALIVTTPEITAIRDGDRVAGLLEANGIYNVKLLVNRVRPDMIQRNDMMSVRDVQEMLGIPLLGAIPEDNHVIISTNRGEPLVLKKKLTLSGIAFENAARRLIGKQDYFIDLTTPYKGVFQKVQEFFLGGNS
jgi:septum site-determining protein MinD